MTSPPELEAPARDERIGVMDEYLISPEDGRILIALQESKSLREAARVLRCDPSGLFRRVQKQSREHGLVRKVRGRWVPTERGQALMAWTRESMLSQKRLFLAQKILRVASTSWMAERALIPAVPRLAKRAPGLTRVEFTVPEEGFEKILLRGSADFVVVCHPPEDPAIAHKQICREEWVAVVSKRLLRRKSPPAGFLERLPFVQHSRANLGALTDETEGGKVPGAMRVQADTLIGVRAAVNAGLGWSVVPKILVAEELHQGGLVPLGERLDRERLSDRKICLWWLRESQEARGLAGALSHWLKEEFEKV